MSGKTDTDQSDQNSKQCYCVSNGDPRPDWDKHHPDGCGNSAYFSTVCGSSPLPSEIKSEPFGQ